MKALGRGLTNWIGPYLASHSDGSEAALGGYNVLIADRGNNRLMGQRHAARGSFCLCGRRNAGGSISLP